MDIYLGDSGRGECDDWRAELRFNNQNEATLIFAASFYWF
jgi:hypothetical protein